jgi:hypothetical protein
MRDPGLDRREWEAEWQALEPLVVDSPAEALPEMDMIVERMLAERGYAGDEDQRAEEAIDPEILAAFRVAREITRRADRGEDVDPGDVGHAVGLYRELYEHLLTRESDTG